MCNAARRIAADIRRTHRKKGIPDYYRTAGRAAFLRRGVFVRFVAVLLFPTKNPVPLLQFLHKNT